MKLFTRFFIALTIVTIALNHIPKVQSSDVLCLMKVCSPMDMLIPYCARNRRTGEYRVFMGGCEFKRNKCLDKAWQLVKKDGTRCASVKRDDDDDDN